MADRADPAALAQAAAVLVQTVLKLKAGESLVVIADADSDAIGQAVRRAAEAAGAQPNLTRLDLVRSVATNSTGERPHKVLPDVVRRALQTAQASCFLASAPHQELSMREQMLHMISAFGGRHCHMPGITARGFVGGFRLGYDKVATWGHGMQRRLELARAIESDSSAGTKLRVELAPSTRWVSRLGEMPPGKCVSLPAGALYASPARVTGTFVANASIGEFFGAHAGVLLQKPVRFGVEEGRITSVDAPQARDLERDIKAMLAVAPNSDRIGMVVLGVNVGIEAPTGDALIDQNLPGLHLVIGDPWSKETGAAWSARTQFTVCQAGARVVIEGVVTIAGGKIISVL